MLCYYVHVLSCMRMTDRNDLNCNSCYKCKYYTNGIAPPHPMFTLRVIDTCSVCTKTEKREKMGR